MMAEHFERWVTEKIPALNGQTPLEAVRDPDGREKVMALVIEAERGARRMNPPWIQSPCAGSENGWGSQTIEMSCPARKSHSQ